MPRAYGVLNAIGSVHLFTHGVVYGRPWPLVMALRPFFIPAANIQVIKLPNPVINNVTAPIRAFLIFYPIINIAFLYPHSAPQSSLPMAFNHWRKTVDETSAHH